MVLLCSHSRWNQPKSPWTDEQISKKGHTMEYYSNLKNKKILTQAIARMNQAHNTK